MLREVRFSGLVFSHPEQIKLNSSKRRFFNSAAAVKSEYDEGEAEDDTSADLNPNAGRYSRFALAAEPPSRHNVRTAVRATRAQYVCFMRGSSFLHSLTGRVDYSLQAYENCPRDPLVRMSLAIASLLRAIQRQADNRHHMIAQV